MQVRKVLSRGIRFLTALGLAAALAMLVGSPAMAADDDHKGWYAALDVALTQPNSLDHHYADQVEAFNPANPQSTRLVLDNDDDTTFRLAVGYDFGGTLGKLQVAYWGFDNEDNENGFVAEYAFPSIFGAGYYGTYFFGYPFGMYVYDGNVTASSSVEATTIDLDYVRPMVTGDKSTVNWLVGLRVATFEETLGFVGNDGGGDYIQERHMESEAFGLRIGTAAKFGFTERFSLEAGAAVSFLQVDLDGDAFQQSGGGAFETREASDDNVVGTIWDLDVRAVWTTRHLDYYVGYSAAIWNELVANPVPANSTAANFLAASLARTRDDIGFNSFHAGVVWRIGGS